ncbi:hypothetical protein [Amycolatopsis aidingensis]|uniref:hypothetical protein n=1 Tax=Amycolatopsis aidingensis TaxID=2842453 RepID=UPI001C0E4F3C|nr:hypothetical protein [Amycolatopsis aidingensis]
MSGRAELVRELKSLRKGRGMFAGRMAERIGPNLRAVCAVTDGDTMVSIREKVANRLAELAEQLPEDLRLATLAAFAINAEARLPLYRDRVLWAAMRMGRDQRTVRRRVDEAIDQLAELAAGAPAYREDDHARTWQPAELRVAAALDRAQPEVLEQHRIVAVQDGLRELDLVPSVPAGPDELEPAVFYGGTLVDGGTAAGEGRGFALTLPRPLAIGESHEFAVRFRLPTARAMSPYLVCVPAGPCELFDLRMRFGPDSPPRRVWRLSGARRRDTSDPAWHGRLCPVDRAGEVHLRFRGLIPDLAYGARWGSESGRSA